MELSRIPHRPLVQLFPSLNILFVWAGHSGRLFPLHGTGETRAGFSGFEGDDLALLVTLCESPLMTLPFSCVK